MARCATTLKPWQCITRGSLRACCRGPATLCDHAQDATSEFPVHAPAPLPPGLPQSPTHNPVGLARITVRSPSGRSCRNRRTSKPRRPTSRRRPRRRTPARVPAVIRNSGGTAGMPWQRRFPGPPGLRGTAFYHDQHKLTQSEPGPEPSGAPLLAAKRQLRGRMKAPAPRLELGTCRLTEGLS
jgi:hypothetical protein